ncbi:MAG: beta-propeller domain-containing protein [Actinobacteria bacterium]|nr:beta-propeller domain-containing protein [Actinomycetota bacterium]
MSRLRAAALLPAAVLTVVALALPVPVGAAGGGGPVIPAAVPRAQCGPGSVAERGMQGRATAADYGTGLRCNLELVGHTGPGIGGFRTHRYADPHGHECAYYDRFPGAPSDPATALGERTGTYVVDMSDPAHPAVVGALNTPAGRSPHESLSVHPGRGLLAANMGTFSTAPGCG